MATFKTKPQGVWATFRTDCHRCNGEVTVSHGRVDPHDCQPDRPVTIWATHEEVAEGQEFYRDTMARLKAALDNRS